MIPVIPFWQIVRRILREHCIERGYPVPECLTEPLADDEIPRSLLKRNQEPDFDPEPSEPCPPYQQDTEDERLNDPRHDQCRSGKFVP